MNSLSNYIIPIIVVIIVLHGAFKGLDIFNLFLEGVQRVAERQAQGDGEQDKP